MKKDKYITKEEEFLEFLLSVVEFNEYEIKNSKNLKLTKSLFQIHNEKEIVFNYLFLNDIRNYYYCYYFLENNKDNNPQNNKNYTKKLKMIAINKYIKFCNKKDYKKMMYNKNSNKKEKYNLIDFFYNNWGISDLLFEKIFSYLDIKYDMEMMSFYDFEKKFNYYKYQIIVDKFLPSLMKIKKVKKNYIEFLSCIISEILNEAVENYFNGKIYKIINKYKKYNNLNLSLKKEVEKFLNKKFQLFKI